MKGKDERKGKRKRIPQKKKNNPPSGVLHPTVARTSGRCDRRPNRTEKIRPRCRSKLAQDEAGRIRLKTPEPKRIARAANLRFLLGNGLTTRAMTGAGRFGLLSREDPRSFPLPSVAQAPPPTHPPPHPPTSHKPHPHNPHWHPHHPVPLRPCIVGI
jgi:hypothetical protein